VFLVLQTGFVLHDDPFITEFRDMMDRKAGLMRDLKHEVARQRDEGIRAAIVAFEFATCTIPPPGTDRAS
jgi:hypothetical protein